MKSYKSLFYFLILQLIPFQGIQADESCQGLVIDFKVSSGKFTGKCDEGSLVWGLIEYDNDYEGHSYNGYFKEPNLRDIGTYEWPSGAYQEGIHYYSAKKSSSLNNGTEYDFFGRSYFPSSGDEAFGFNLNNECNGFCIYFFGNHEDDPEENSERELGIMSGEGSKLNGYGYRRINSVDYYAFWESGEAIGNIYALSDDDSVEMYTRSNSGDVLGPYSLKASDKKRYKTIKDFLDKLTTQALNKWEPLEDSFKDYKETIKIAFEVEGEDIETEESLNISASSSDNISYKADLIKSIQELLAVLNYSPGDPDGVLGKRTISAIKAFQVESNLEMTGIANDDLLVSLQLAIKKISSKTDTAPEPKYIGSGTGFYINDENIITNHHVISSCEFLTDFADNRLAILQQDQVNDLALLRGKASKSFLSISKISPDLGEKIYVAGFPYNNTLKGFNFTSGNVSSLIGLGQDVANFQITAPVQPGNSGGAILNEYGSVVGVTVARINDETIMQETNTVPQNINFGIKNTILKSLLSDNNINFEEKDSYFRQSQKSIAKSSREASVLIKCYGYNK